MPPRDAQWMSLVPGTLKATGQGRLIAPAQTRSCYPKITQKGKPRAHIPRNQCPREVPAGVPFPALLSQPLAPAAGGEFPTNEPPARLADPGAPPSFPASKVLAKTALTAWGGCTGDTGESCQGTRAGEGRSEAQNSPAGKDRRSPQGTPQAVPEGFGRALWTAGSLLPVAEGA